MCHRVQWVNVSEVKKKEVHVYTSIKSIRTYLSVHYFPRTVCVLCMFLFFSTSFNCWKFMIYNKNNNQIVWMTKWNASDMHTTWTLTTSASSYPTALLSTTIVKLHLLTQCVLWFVCIPSSTRRIQYLQCNSGSSITSYNPNIHSFTILKFSHSSNAFSMNRIHKKDRERKRDIAQTTDPIYLWARTTLNMIQDYHASAYAK